MIWFKERKELEEQFYSWLRKNPEIDNSPFNVISFLCIIDRLKTKDDQWIPFTLDYDEEEKKEMLSCPLPDDYEEILVTDGESVWSDTFFNEGEEGCYLDSNCDLIDTVIAWRPLPKPYRGEK